MGAVPDLEQAFVERMTDEDHVVRAEAARALGTCRSQAALEALGEARTDRSLVVREAVEESLELLQSCPTEPMPKSGAKWGAKALVIPDVSLPPIPGVLPPAQPLS
jgi:HEAT repeat protein